MKKECFICDVDIELISFFKELVGSKPNFWSFEEATGELYLYRVKNKNFLILKREGPWYPTLYLSFNVKNKIICLNYKMNFKKYVRGLTFISGGLFVLSSSFYAFVVMALVGIFFFSINYIFFLDEVKNTNKEIKLFFKKKGVVLEPHQCIGN